MKYIFSLSFILCCLFPFAATAAPFSVGDGQFTVVAGEKTFPVSSDEILGWATPLTAQNPGSLRVTTYDPAGLMAAWADGGKLSVPVPPSRTFSYNPARVLSYVRTIAPLIEQAPVEPKMTIEGGRVTEFEVPRDGTELQRSSSVQVIAEAILSGQATATLPIATAAPVTLLSDTNTLGITELVATGQSSYRGSPSNRRHNIRVGVEKMRGVLIAPGEEFSFNKFLGPVDGEHGFLPELVIKKTGTVPEFGGGLCQVSSTVFRGAVNAGLPITQRRNHAYAVQYYAPQGTDATIYPGVVDLKFTNDTEGHMLVWPHYGDGDKLFFDLYGKKDDRTITVGTPEQYDRKPDGSLKATWSRVVIKDGVTATDTWKSVYQSPALFHKTEEFAQATTGPNGLLQIPAQPHTN